MRLNQASVIRERLRVLQCGSLGGTLGRVLFGCGFAILHVASQLVRVGRFNQSAHSLLVAVAGHPIGHGFAQRVLAQHVAIHSIHHVGLVLVGVAHTEIGPAIFEQFGLCLGAQFGLDGVLVGYHGFKRRLELLWRGLAVAHGGHGGVVAVNGWSLAGGLLLWHTVCIGQALPAFGVHLVDDAGQRHGIGLGRSWALCLVGEPERIPQAINAELIARLADPVDLAKLVFAAHGVAHVLATLKRHGLHLACFAVQALQRECVAVVRGRCRLLIGVGIRHPFPPCVLVGFGVLGVTLVRHHHKLLPVFQQRSFQRPVNRSLAACAHAG